MDCEVVGVGTCPTEGDLEGVVQGCEGGGGGDGERAGYGWGGDFVGAEMDVEEVRRAGVLGFVVVLIRD